MSDDPLVVNYETAPVHPDFAPPWHALTGYPLPWEWIAILEQPSGNLIAMAINPSVALEIVSALKAQEVRNREQRQAIAGTHASAPDGPGSSQ